MISLMNGVVSVGLAGLVVTLLFQNLLPPEWRPDYGPFIFVFSVLIMLGVVVTISLTPIPHYCL